MLKFLKKFKVNTADPMKDDFEQHVAQFDAMQEMLGQYKNEIECQYHNSEEDDMTA